jgi:hypothetical protein
LAFFGESLNIYGSVGVIFKRALFNSVAVGARGA